MISFKPQPLPSQGRALNTDSIGGWMGTTGGTYTAETRNIFLPISRIEPDYRVVYPLS
jgi:hypothetical protein